MARFIEIESSTDPRLADYVRLRDAQLRQSLESERGLYIAEGQKVIRRALEAGHRPRSFLLAPRWIEGLRDLLDCHEVEVFVAPEEVTEQVTGFHVHRGALAAFHRPTTPALLSVAAGSRVVVCHDIVDHSNVGAIIRTVAGLGWDSVVLSSRCADPLYRRAVKTSMGAALSLPWARFEDDLQGLQQLKQAGFTLVAAALADGAVALGELPDSVRQARIALMLGTEGDGLSQDWLDLADVVVSIPMAAGIDSLNVGAAAAVLCWDLRQRSPEGVAPQRGGAARFGAQE